MRSDAAPALSQSISPTWTGTHTFNGTVGGSALLNYLAAPPAIGGSTPAAGSFTTLTATSSVSGAGVTALFASPPAIGGTTPAGSRFTFAHTAPSNIGNSGTAFTLDCGLSNVFTLTMTGNVAGANWTINNAKDGQTVNLFITQGAGYTLAWPTSFKWPGGSAGTISTSNGQVDLLVMTYRAATGFWYCSLLKAFA